MSELILNAGLAVWLGILTSISPCPLATNIVAISYIGRKVDRPVMILMTGLLYTLGRALTYSVLGVLLVSSVLSAPRISFWLQINMVKIIGPILIVAGMFLLGLLGAAGSGRSVSEKVMSRVERMGIWGAGLLGILFALSFCPTSAAFFFGSLLPLAIGKGSAVMLPSVYGIGTALPVVVFAVLIASGARYLGEVFNRLSSFELWSRRITGGVFIAAGIYFSIRYIFKLF